MSKKRGVPEDDEQIGLLYYRQGDLIRLKLSGLTNHELRCILLGLWARLEEDDRADFLEELRHYHTDPGARLPPLSKAIASSAPEAPRGLPDPLAGDDTQK